MMPIVVRAHVQPGRPELGDGAIDSPQFLRPFPPRSWPPWQRSSSAPTLVQRLPHPPPPPPNQHNEQSQRGPVSGMVHAAKSLTAKRVRGHICPHAHARCKH